MLEDASPDAAERAAPYDFDQATAVAPGADGSGYGASVDPGWTIGGRPNGGYLLALATRAALAEAGRPDPLAVSAHYLSPPAPGPVGVAVTLLRAGRSVSVLRATLGQDGAACLEALVSAGQLDGVAEPLWRADRAPELPPPDECVPGQSEMENGVQVPILDHIDVRLDPATAGWALGRPARRAEMRGWVRFHDGRPPDSLALLQAVDALPPVSFELGVLSWAPTLELTAYVRRPPAPGWLACVARGRMLQGGWFDEEAEVWDERGALVAQSRQLAGARAPQPSESPPPSGDG
jgi:acyl-CoA thioesterase